MSGPHCDATIHRVCHKRAPLLLTTKVSIICLAIKPPEMEPATDQRKANVIYAALVLIHFIN